MQDWCFKYNITHNCVQDKVVSGLQELNTDRRLPCVVLYNQCKFWSSDTKAFSRSVPPLLKEASSMCAISFTLSIKPWSKGLSKPAAPVNDDAAARKIISRATLVRISKARSN